MSKKYISGAVVAAERPEFIRLPDCIENGDVLIVIRLDRLVQNASDIRKTVERFSMSEIEGHGLAWGRRLIRISRSRSSWPQRIASLYKRRALRQKQTARSAMAHQEIRYMFAGLQIYTRVFGWC